MIQNLARNSFDQTTWFTHGIRVAHVMSSVHLFIVLYFGQKGRTWLLWRTQRPECNSPITLIINPSWSCLDCVRAYVCNYWYPCPLQRNQALMVGRVSSQRLVRVGRAFALLVPLQL
ncbi:hypothetical protein CK203_020823 [Vitis vinifera]|uniref:Uncharacterized protein n=1 Tax=Vitis vinifera TaxID=29760 RepID=A0A438II52_VITVI|nr:hypothetical protein CK203_020823 [Vitis vinifera]